jgi:hypothetical protein
VVCRKQAVHTVGGIGLGHHRFDQQRMRFHAGSHWEETDCLLEGDGFEPPVPREKVRQRVPRERLKDEFEVRSTRRWSGMDSNFQFRAR